jgi:exonuclease I
VSWSRRFDEPILLPDGREIRTLREVINWLAKEVPKTEHKMEKVQTAAHLVTRAAEHGGPMIFAQMGMMQAIHRHRPRVFDPDRKDHHWGKRKLKRDQ